MGDELVIKVMSDDDGDGDDGGDGDGDGDCGGWIDGDNVEEEEEEGMVVIKVMRG